MKTISLISLAIIFISCNQSFNNNPTAKKDTLAITNPISSQRSIDSALIDKLKKADTVLLISHIGSVSNEAKGDIFPDILIGQKLNFAIVKERKKLSKGKIDSLIVILSLPTNIDNIVLSRCFDPHQTILIYKNNKISYIDMCFHCWGLRTSEDLNEIKGYDVSKWKKIQLFFKQNGFVYKMETE